MPNISIKLVIYLVIRFWSNVPASLKVSYIFIAFFTNKCFWQWGNLSSFLYRLDQILLSPIHQCLANINANKLTISNTNVERVCDWLCLGIKAKACKTTGKSAYRGKVCYCHRPCSGVDMTVQKGGVGEGKLFGFKI